MRNCSNSLDKRNQHPTEPIISHEIPEILWTKIDTDIFELHKQPYAIDVDYITKFFDIDSLRGKQSQLLCILKHVCEIRHPTLVISDNGPEFKTNKF